MPIHVSPFIHCLIQPSTVPSAFTALLECVSATYITDIKKKAITFLFFKFLINSSESHI